MAEAGPSTEVVTALTDMAERFLIYASDQLACQRYLGGVRRRAALRLKAEIWTEAARELTEAAKELLA